MPVLGVLTPGAEYRIGPPPCGPELNKVVIDGAVGKFPQVPFIPAFGTDAQPVGTQQKFEGPTAHINPGTPHHVLSVRNRDGDLDYILPLPGFASRWSVQQDHPNRRAARPPGEVYMHPGRMGSTNQAVDLPFI